MKNVLSKIRFIETFAIITFPIALTVGCTATGEQKSAMVSPQEESTITQQQASIEAGDLNTLTYVQTKETMAVNEQEPMVANDEAVIAAEPGVDAVASNFDIDADKEINSRQEITTIKEQPQMLEVKLHIPERPAPKMPGSAIFHFAVNKHDIAEQDYALLKAHAEYLQENPGLVVNINGYSDNRGPAKLNYELGKKRAQQVAAILMTYGVSESQINVNSYGESFPLNDENNWDENRRVELRYTEKPQTDEMVVNAF